MSHILKRYGYTSIPSLISSLITHAAQLPDNFDDFASQYYGDKQITNDFVVHCYHELTHEQWILLLDDEFLHAYEHGIVHECSDAIKRRFYP